MVAGEQREILKTAIRLTEVLDLVSITEGIETEQQLQVVKELRSQYVQGFLFDRALPVETLKERLAVEYR